VNLVQGLLGFMPMIIGNVLLFVMSLIAMLWLSPVLTLIASPSRRCCGSSRTAAGATCSGQLGRSARRGRGGQRRRGRHHRRTRG